MIKFQHAIKSDIPLLQQLAHTIWHNHYPGIISVQQIEYMLNKMYSATQILKELEASYFWVLIFDNAQPVGFMAYHLDNEDLNMKLDKLYVLVTYHGKGIGQASLEYVKSEAKKVNASKLYLTVNKQNTKAIQAYIKAGFSVDCELVTDIGNGYVMDDYQMSISI
jgi:diamine N-acetyltransferase